MVKKNVKNTVLKVNQVLKDLGFEHCMINTPVAKSALCHPPHCESDSCFGK